MIIITEELIEKLGLLLAVVYNDSDAYLYDSEFYDQIVDAHTAWADIHDGFSPINADRIED